MQCISLIQEGQTVKVQLDNATSSGACPSLVVLSNADYQTITLATATTAEPITAETVTSVFGWGFGVVLFFWSLGYAVGVAKQIINKV